MGFYIRKGFNFGPLRLNLSRSGLGASVGVKGARIGIGPRGSYLHLGRDGFYYRQSLSPVAAPQARELPTTSPPPAISADIQEISSANASTIVDASATDLLEELNRIKRRFDIFPIIVAVGGILLVAVLLSGFQWWFALAGSAAIAMLAIAGRHHDVTSGTAVLNYGLESGGEAEFSKLQTAFESVVACQRFWHVDAAGFISDWKRNAGASSLINRSEAQALFALPSKVICNLKVPSIKAKHKSLYFFPDRLLIYDPTGVGAVSYPELHSATAHARYIENEVVPSDSPQIGTTWRYVAKNGGPDRRFKDNRQLPILQYGVLALTSNSGVSEMFQCSAPDAPVQFVAEVAVFGQKTSSTGGGVFFDVPRRAGMLTGATLGVGIALMAIMAAVLFWNMLPPAESSQEAQARAEAARRQFETGLSQSITAAARHKNVSVSSADDGLLFTFTSEGPKAARRDGLTPFNKKTFFTEFLTAHTEAELCGLGFKKLEFSANGSPPTQQQLDCVGSP
jgi:hypothetical protein